MSPRTLWTVFEPLHAVVYFTPEPVAAAKAAGLRGWWMGYFAGRLAPLGPIGAPPATSMLFGFAPAMVARALPDAWTFAQPADVVSTRLTAAEAALTRVLPPGEYAELAELLELAVSGCGFDGRPLAAGWAAVPRPDGILARIWLAATVLREHRGDGHVLAAVHAGLRGLEATVTHVAAGAFGREDVQPHRGWTDAEWESAEDRLRDKGLLDPAGLTSAGLELRRSIEDATDRLAAGPLEALGPSAVERLVELAEPLSRHLFDAGAVPPSNPIGVPRP